MKDWESGSDDIIRTHFLKNHDLQLWTKPTVCKELAMIMLRHLVGPLVLLSVINSAAALPEAITINVTTTEQPSIITQIHSTTLIFVTCGFFAPAPTALFSITTSTITTLIPAVTSYPATVLETLIREITWEYRYYNSDPTSDMTSFASGIYTDAPVTTVLGGPMASGAIKGDGTVTGIVCECREQPAHTLTPCGAQCCVSTWAVWV